MRAKNIALGMVIGASLAVGITASQAETKVVHGESHRVVASVTRGRVYETPLVNRCLRIGLPAGLVGAGIGYFASNGANLSAAFLGGLVLWSLSASWRETWDEKFGRAGANAQVSDSFLHGLVGGLLGAAAVAHLSKHHPSLPRRLQPPEPMDAPQGPGVEIFDPQEQMKDAELIRA